MQFVSPADMENLKIDISNIRALAANNLDNYYDRIAASIQQLDTQGQGEIFLLAADENYEASALLSSGLWHKENIPVAGEVSQEINKKETINDQRSMVNC